MNGFVLTSLTVVVAHDFGTETGRAFATCANEHGGALTKKLSQEQLDALTEWLEALDMEGDE